MTSSRRHRFSPRLKASDGVSSVPEYSRAPVFFLTGFSFRGTAIFCFRRPAGFLIRFGSGLPGFPGFFLHPPDGTRQGKTGGKQNRKKKYGFLYLPEGKKAPEEEN